MFFIIKSWNLSDSNGHSHSMAIHSSTIMPIDIIQRVWLLKLLLQNGMDINTKAAAGEGRPKNCSVCRVSKLNLAKRMATQQQ